MLSGYRTLSKRERQKTTRIQQIAIGPIQELLRIEGASILYSLEAGAGSLDIVSSQLMALQLLGVD